MTTRLSKILLIAPVLLAIIVDYFGWGLVYPLATAIFDDPNSGLLSATVDSSKRDFYLSLSFLIYPLCLLFGASSLGDLSDISGRKKILFLCTTGIGLSFLCMGVGVFSGVLSLFLIGRALSGFMAGCAPIAQAVVVDISAPEDKPFNLALLSLTFAIGLILGPLVGSFLSDSRLVSWFGYTTPFIFSAILAFATALWIKTKFSYQERVNPVKTFSLTRFFSLFREVLRNIELRHLASTLFLFQFGVSLYIQTMLIFLNTKLHYTSVGLALFWVVMGAGFVLGLILLKRLLKTPIHISQMIFLSLIFQGAIIVLSSFLAQETSLWILGFFFSLLNPFSYALLMAVFSDTAPQESQGWIMGVWSAIIAVSFIAGALCNNFIPWVGLDPVIFFGGLLVGLSAFAFRRFVRR
jgi:MFS family permease